MAEPKSRTDELERQVLALRVERDEALRALGVEKARYSSHLLTCPFPLRRVEPDYDDRAEPPLRHRVVDWLNDAVKNPGTVLKSLRSARRSGDK